VQRTPGWGVVEDLSTLPLPARDLVAHVHYRLSETLTGNRPFLLDGLRSYTTWNASG
jgi:hypothetical protein